MLSRVAHSFVFSVVIACVPAVAQDDNPAFHETREDIDRPSVPGSPGFLRAHDQSDPEMKQLLDQFFELTPCGDSATGLCPEALEMLRGGGDRLASYLITQHEQNELAGLPNRGTYLRLLGHTESNVAFQYLSRLVNSRRNDLEANPAQDKQPLIFAVEALGRTRDLRSVPILVALIDDFSDPEIRLRAVNAADRVQTKHGAQPEIVARLTLLQRELSASLAGVSQQTGAPSETPNGTLAWRVGAVLAAPGTTRP